MNARIDKIKTRIDKIKTHLEENKKAYIGTAIGVVLGAMSVLILKNPPVLVSTKETLTFKWQSPTITQIILPALGDPGNVVQCIETGSIYASQGQAARELGVSAARVSDHLTGLLPHIKGNHLKVLGKAGQPLA